MRSREDVLQEFDLADVDGLPPAVEAMADRIRSLEATPARDAEGIQTASQSRGVVTEAMVERAVIVMRDNLNGCPMCNFGTSLFDNLREVARLALTEGTPDA
jgi:hypothetical protein